MGEKPFRARQLMKWLYKRCVADFDQMTDLAKTFRERLKEVAVVATPSITTDAGFGRRHAQVAARDGRHAGHRDGLHPRARPRHAVHFQPGRLRDGLHVLLDRAARIQSQPHRRRDRRPGVARESRAVGSATWQPGGDRVITNVVFMGMGEPLANYRNVVPAAEILMDDLGFDISRRRVTVSTSGLVPQMLRARRGNQLRAGRFAARAERRAARPAGADQPQASDRRAARCLLAVREQAERAQHHVRVRDARRHQRPAGARARARAAAARAGRRK